jgi:hypothetical protein
MEEALRRAAMDAGLRLFVHLYAVSGEKNWLETGLTLAESPIACYFDAVLPRGDAARPDSF